MLPQSVRSACALNVIRSTHNSSQGGRHVAYEFGWVEQNEVFCSLRLRRVLLRMLIVGLLTIGDSRAWTERVHHD